jgi:UDPglucose 6-dehydrogenase
LAFKPNTDDMREAPSRVLLESLWAAGARVRAYDPVAQLEAGRLYASECESGQLQLVSSAPAALDGADVLAIVTEWQEFRSPDFEGVRAALKYPVIVDGRNLYDPALVARHGLRYFAIGRGESVSPS